MLSLLCLFFFAVHGRFLMILFGVAHDFCVLHRSSLLCPVLVSSLFCCLLFGLLLLFPSLSRILFLSAVFSSVLQLLLPPVYRKLKNEDFLPCVYIHRAAAFESCTLLGAWADSSKNFMVNIDIVDKPHSDFSLMNIQG